MNCLFIWLSVFAPKFVLDFLHLPLALIGSEVNDFLNNYYVLGKQTDIHSIFFIER